MAENKLTGKAHVYKRDDINTDEIIPARYLNTDKEKELAQYAMEDLDKTFVKKVKPGDFIVAAENFGCGSSREHAIWALRGAGVKAVIANSFARIFFRNAINNGFLAIEFKGAADKIKDGAGLEIDIKAGKIINKDKGEEYSFLPLSDFAVELLNDGGLINHIKNKGAKR